MNVLDHNILIMTEDVQRIPNPHRHQDHRQHGRNGVQRDADGRHDPQCPDNSKSHHQQGQQDTTQRTENEKQHGDNRDAEQGNHDTQIRQGVLSRGDLDHRPTGHIKMVTIGGGHFMQGLVPVSVAPLPLAPLA